jgi:hypothetical protein
MTNLTISAFYPGLTLQQITASQVFASYVKCILNIKLLNIEGRVDASTRNALFSPAERSNSFF